MDPNDNSLSFLQVLSNFNNLSTDPSAKYYNAHLDSSLNSSDEHIDIEIALHSVTFTNNFYNVHENDRLIFYCVDQSGNSNYVEVLVAAGYYTTTDFNLNWPNFPAYNHGPYIGAKPDYYTVTKTVTTLKNGGSTYNNGTIATYLPNTLNIELIQTKFSFENSSSNNVILANVGYLMKSVKLALPGNVLGLPIHMGFLNRHDSVETNIYEALFNVVETAPGSGFYFAEITNISQMFPWCYNMFAHEFLMLNFLEADMDNLNSYDKFQLGKTVLVVPINAPHGVSQTWADPNPIYHSVTDGKLLGIHIDWKDPNGDVVDFNNTQWCVNFVYRFAAPDYGNFSLANERRTVAVTNQDRQNIDVFTPPLLHSDQRLSKLQRTLK